MARPPTHISELLDEVSKVIESFISNEEQFTILDISEQVKKELAVSHQDVRIIAKPILDKLIVPILGFYEVQEIEVDTPNGKALAKCFYVDENDKYTLNQRICALTVKNNKELNAKFLFYTLNRNKQLLRYDSGADQTNLRKDDILNIQIPIQPLAEQQRIVAILDKFDALVNDIFAGLPAELNARRKQYEYYRDKLLTFKEFHSSRGQPPRPGGHPSRGGE